MGTYKIGGFVAILFILFLIYYVSRPSGELSDSEGRRLRIEVGMLNQKLDEAKTEADKRRNELERIQLFSQKVEVAKDEEINNGSSNGSLLNNEFNNCQMDDCFDYSFCPLSSKFQFYLYSNISTKNVLHNVLSHSPYITSDYTQACLFLIIIEDCNPQKLTELSSNLWFADGRNHVLWVDCEIQFPNWETFDFGWAMVITKSARRGRYRSQFDLVVSHWDSASTKDQAILQLPPLLPAKRKYLSTFLGGETEKLLQSELQKIQEEDPQSFLFQFSCDIGNKSDKSEINSGPDERTTTINPQSQNMSLCEELFLNSTFTLIILPLEDTDTLSSDVLQQRLFESLMHGCIPVVIGTRFLPPFSEVIDWSKILIMLPRSRIREMQHILKSFTDADIIQMKKQGRAMFEKYLNSAANIAETVLAVLRTRIGIPPSPYDNVGSPSVFNAEFLPLKLDSFNISAEEKVGPVEPPYPSASFIRNYSTLYFQKYDLWNKHFQPVKLFPFTPWDPVVPSEAGKSSLAASKFGKRFNETLGGNNPKEQFTIVVLTYKREVVLTNYLQLFFSLPFLNKVVVVWNSPDAPSKELKWPEIGVPIHVIKAERNSLNNRFLPYDAIETEAILSMDDDTHLHHDEIVFGFRVWRENRNRIVGYPARSHKIHKDLTQWLYDPGQFVCERSLVLTGASFFHKVYSYLYTYEMPAPIRDKVDELMNCEDIAMNFLIAHVTNKPPVLMNTRSGFHCPLCNASLSSDSSHYQERNYCINYFTEVYGYTPLLYTQFRADSILYGKGFKEKDRCFLQV